MKAVRYFLIFVAVALAAALIADMTFLGTAAAFIRDGRMAYGLKVGNTPIGGMTREEASREIQRLSKTALNGKALILSLPDENQAFSFSTEEVGLSVDADAMLEAAYNIGRSGSTAQQIITVLECAFQGKEAPLAATLDEVKFHQVLQSVKQSVDRAPKDASIVFTPTGIEHQPGLTGRRLDADALSAKVKPRLLELRLPCRETLTPEETEPEIQLEDINAVNARLSSCTTYYIADTGRGDNIEIAAAALDNCIVRPGDELSFNATVGSRVASAGYAVAPVIINGKTEQDIGGGVCQVSSTLYNAILTAGLTATARTAHYYPSAYVDAGLDATVADGQIDFAFRNTLPHAVLLRSGAFDGTLTISVYGCTEDLPGVMEMESVIIGPPPTVEVYRLTYVGDQLVNREYLYTDEYDVPPPPEEEKKPTEDQARFETAPSPVPNPAPAQTPLESKPSPAAAPTTGGIAPTEAHPPAGPTTPSAPTTVP
ncbi:MAG: VanW family protein, partial [Schwartzia sp.]|nr:VanW family protein [Schwartzia sp. (in: firmicutes)]